MARAIFGTYPENEKKCKFLKIPKVKFFSKVWLFLTENIILMILFNDLKNRPLKLRNKGDIQFLSYGKIGYYFSNQIF